MFPVFVCFGGSTALLLLLFSDHEKLKIQFPGKTENYWNQHSAFRLMWTHYSRCRCFLKNWAHQNLRNTYTLLSAQFIVEFTGSWQ